MTELRDFTLGFRPAARRAVDVLAASRLGSIKSVHTDQPLMALTFDDGPDPDCTPRVLDVLAGRQAHATFFMLVQNARRFPELVHRVVADGHEVALHGVDHRSLAGQSRKSTLHLLVAALLELSMMSGTPVVYFRPPFGEQTVGSFLGARDAGLDCVMWDLDSFDWRGGDERQVASRVVAQTVPGDIVLLHDGFAGDAHRGFDRAKTVDLVVDGLQRRTLHSTTITHLIASGSVHRTAWFSFRPRSSSRV